MCRLTVPAEVQGRGHDVEPRSGVRVAAARTVQLLAGIKGLHTIVSPDPSRHAFACLVLSVMRRTISPLG
jgi:hypothetical protein